MDNGAFCGRRWHAAVCAKKGGEDSRVSDVDFRMSRRLTPNINGAGRLIRAAMALLLFVGAAFAVRHSWLLATVLAACGLFVLFEAVRGWCALRACGIRTRL